MAKRPVRIIRIDSKRLTSWQNWRWRCGGKYWSKLEGGRSPLNTYVFRTLFNKSSCVYTDAWAFRGIRKTNIEISHITEVNMWVKAGNEKEKRKRLDRERGSTKDRILNRCYLCFRCSGGAVFGFSPGLGIILPFKSKISLMWVSRVEEKKESPNHQKKLMTVFEMLCWNVESWFRMGNRKLKGGR